MLETGTPVIILITGRIISLDAAGNNVWQCYKQPGIQKFERNT